VPSDRDLARIERWLVVAVAGAALSLVGQVALGVLLWRAGR
jgi:hypothetical protein